MSRLAVALGLGSVGVLAGIFSLDAARQVPAYSFAGGSAVGAAALLGAGWALIGCGLLNWLRRPDSQFGPLLAAAGFAWFVLEWNSPEISSALAFTVGLCFYAACPPIVAHAVCAYSTGWVVSPLVRAAIAVGYGATLLVLGILPALFFDPQAQACSECPRNLLLVADHGELAADFTRAGITLGTVWALGLTILVALRLERRPAAARLVLGAAAAYLGLVAVGFAVSIDRGFLAPGSLERKLWLGQAAALAGIVVGVGWAWGRARRARSEVAQLVVDLAQTPPPGGLRDVLATIVGDPALQIAYPLSSSDRLVDAHGRAVELSDDTQQTTLVRDGHPVAVLAHAPGLLDDAQLVDEVTTAGRLALENERLQAEVSARLEELRASRARIVEAGDSERKRLERDLHDGAQQRLVGLLLSLRLLRSRHPGIAELVAADAELRAATTELRELAHGIFPAVLADEGLAAAIEALTEEARVPVEIHGLPDGVRLAPPVETTAYTIVAEAVRAATAKVAVHAEAADGTLVLEVETHENGTLDRVALEDRVGALDGRLELEHAKHGQVTIHAELPCGS